MGNMGKGRLTPELQDLYRKYYTDSLCNVKLHKKDGLLISVWIEFVGKAARLPSKARENIVAFPKRSGGGTRPMIVKSPQFNIRQRVATDLYIEFLVKNGIPLPNFGSDPVHIQAMLCAKPGRWDRDNIEKFLGDWAMSIGLMDDDSTAEVRAYKKADYITGNRDFLGTTRIVVQRRSQVLNLVEAHIAEIEQASTGVQFIGRISG